jgi:galactokinase
LPDPTLTSFTELFGDMPEVNASAPGRVNLIGEHTDYNGGFVLPTIIPQVTRVQLRRRPGDEVSVWSGEIAELGDGGVPAMTSYQLGQEQRTRGWVDYVQGVTRALVERGHKLGGFQARITSEVPLGAGLSSSAALEVALLRALRKAFMLDLDDVDLALVGQRAENDLVGAPVGVMDQMASSVCTPGHALFLDTHSLARELVPLPHTCELVVIDSGLTHEHASGEYRVRRQECHQAAQLLGVPTLRELDVVDLDRLAVLPEHLGRRARHVVTENARVLNAVAAIKADDVAGLGLLLLAAHASLRDDFEVSTPEIDTLVRLAEDDGDVLGARMTGGGFGGSVVILADQGCGAAAGARIAHLYTEQVGRLARVLVPRPGQSRRLSTLPRSTPGPTM